MNLEKDYLYFGLGIIGILLVIGLAITFFAPVDLFSKAPQTISVTLEMPNSAYSSNVSQEALFSAQPATMLFSPVYATQNPEIIKCVMNCVKTR